VAHTGRTSCPYEGNVEDRRDSLWIAIVLFCEKKVSRLPLTNLISKDRSNHKRVKLTVPKTLNQLAVTTATVLLAYEETANELKQR
jgi:hypothetical protein